MSDPMKTIEVKAYSCKYRYADDPSGRTFGSYIGVCKDMWHDAIEDSYIDNKCFYFMSDDEFDRAEIGDIIGEAILESIDKECEFSEVISYNSNNFDKDGRKL